MPKARPGPKRYQVNVPLDDEHWFLALQQVAIRDGKSVPELLRPVILGFIKRRMTSDPQLAAAVASIETSRDQERDRRRRKLAPVADFSTTRTTTRHRASKAKVGSE